MSLGTILLIVLIIILLGGFRALVAVRSRHRLLRRWRNRPRVGDRVDPGLARQALSAPQARVIHALANEPPTAASA